MYMEIEFFCIISHMTPTRLIKYICVNIKYISRGYCRSKGCHKDVKRVKYSYKMLIIKNRQKCKILNCPQEYQLFIISYIIPRNHLEYIILTSEM